MNSPLLRLPSQGDFVVALPQLFLGVDHQTRVVVIMEGATIRFIDTVLGKAQKA